MCFIYTLVVSFMSSFLKILFLFFFLASCHSFDSEKWINDKSSREGQLESIIKSKILIGKTYQEVINILGKEDQYRIDDSLSTDKFSIQYVVGGCNFIDFKRLRIIFEKSQVIEAEEYCD